MSPFPSNLGPDFRDVLPRAAALSRYPGAMAGGKLTWTNPSVLKLAKDRNPEEAVLDRARTLVLDAVETGWTGPPFDPLELARREGIEVVATEEVQDARLVSVGGRHPRIEFNPNRPRSRTRYSLAHEIAHTLFADWAETVRNRVAETRGLTDDWQLELLCNLAAAEILMPAGGLEAARDSLDFDSIVALAKHYDVSHEAMFLRVIRLSSQRSAIVLAAPQGPTNNNAYRIDYVVTAGEWNSPFRPGQTLAQMSAFAECSAVGFTATTRGLELQAEQVDLQCVGLPPYPGYSFPRVLALVTPTRPGRVKPTPQIEYLVGDATAPRGSGIRIVAFVVNDKTPRWGGGFALAVRKEWPHVQQAFIDWVGQDRGRLSLGRTFLVPASTSAFACCLIAQRGYGPSAKPRIRYASLREALMELGQTARSLAATVHMPRIGAGQAGGDWEIIKGLIAETLLARRIKVTVYDLPGTPRRVTAQEAFSLFG